MSHFLIAFYSNRRLSIKRHLDTRMARPYNARLARAVLQMVPLATDTLMVK
jgi:hypothetical protein